MTEHWLDADDVLDAYEVFCPHCRYSMVWEDCDQCGGEGYFDWETLQFEDPLWYDPGDTETCEQCDGKGGWWMCDNTRCPPKKA